MSCLRRPLPLALPLSLAALTAAACSTPELTPTSVNLPGNVRMTEGGVRTLDITLNNMPGVDITLVFTSSDGDRLEVNPASLVFTPHNWSAAQNITLSAVENDVAAGAPATTTVEMESTSGGSHNEPLRDAFNVSIDDNDEAGVIVDAASDLETHELGTSATFTIALTSRPFAAVSIPLATTDATEGVVSPAELVIEPSAWRTRHEVKVTGVPEKGLDGNVHYAVEVGESKSEDEAYRGLDPDDVSLLNRDFGSEEFAPIAHSAGADVPVAGVSADGELVAFVNAGQAVVWNPRTHDEWRYGADVVHAALASGGTVLAYSERSATVSRLLIVDDLTGGSPIVVFDPAEPATTIRGLALSRDGRYLAFETDAGQLPSESSALESGQGRLGGVVLLDTTQSKLPTRIDETAVNDLTLNWSGNPSISDDGKVIAFEASFRTEGGPYIAIWRSANGLFLPRAPTGGVPNTAATSSPVVSSDGRVVVFSAHQQPALQAGPSNPSIAYAYDVGGSKAEKLTTGTPSETLLGYAPTVSADGNVIALEGASDGDDPPPLLIHKRATRETRRVDLSDSGEPIGRRCSAVAPPSAFLAFLCESSNEDVTLHFVELDDAFWQSAPK